MPPEVASILRQLDHSRQNVIYVVNKIDLVSPAIGPDAVLRDLKAHLIDANLPLSDQPLFPVSCLNNEISNSTGTRPGLRTEYENGPSLQLSTSFLGRESTILPSQAQGRTGLPAFLEGLTSLFASKTCPLAPKPGHPSSQSTTATSLGASERHRLLLQQCLSHLEDYLASYPMQQVLSSAESMDIDTDVVLAAEHLRSAADCLARITGKGEAGDVDEVRGVVFEKFCVGK